MAELDGTWNVRRTRRAPARRRSSESAKHIDGANGETRVGPLPGAPSSTSSASSLRYRAPFGGFVDRLEPDGDGYLGRATFRGHEFGRFALERL